MTTRNLQVQNKTAELEQLKVNLKEQLIEVEKKLEKIFTTENKALFEKI